MSITKSTLTRNKFIIKVFVKLVIKIKNQPKIKRCNIKSWHISLSSLWFFNQCSTGLLSPLFSWADVNSQNMTQAATWIQYLDLLMWFTGTKESVPTIDNPHDVIMLSKPLPSVSERQRRRIDFLNELDPNKQKSLSEPNLSGNFHWSSFNNSYSGWSLSSTQIWPGFNSFFVFSTISMQWCSVSNVCTGASAKERIAIMSDFLVWWLLWEWYLAYAVQKLVALAVLIHATLSDISFL